MNLDQLLEFCSYYNLIKSTTHLPITPSVQGKPPAPKEEKTVRRKIQKIEPKKPVQVDKPIRPKMEFAGRTQKKSVSPIAKDPNIVKEQPKIQRPKKIEIVQEPKNLTLDFFINHISTQQNTHTANKHSSSPDYTKNYQTFGRTMKQDYHYETYQEKFNRNRGNLTDRNERKNYDITSFSYKPEEYTQAFNAQPFAQSISYKQDAARTNNPNFGFSQTYNASQFSNNFVITNSQIQKPMWQKPIADNKVSFPLHLDSSKHDSMLLYSPSRRENLPYGSSSVLRISPDRSLSKSQTQHKRKNSERPFYNPSQLTPPRTDRNSEMRERQMSEVHLSKSISVLELPQNSCYPTKKDNEDQNRRQTSTTTVRNKRARDVVLDDECEEYLVAALGKAPIPVNIDRSSH